MKLPRVLVNTVKAAATGVLVREGADTLKAVGRALRSVPAHLREVKAEKESAR